MSYSYDVQYVDFDTYEVEDKGSIDSKGAIEAFRSFPFKEQQKKARSLPSPTFPTISFRSDHDDAVLATWSLEPDIFEVYMEINNMKVTVETDDQSYVENTIKDFFQGSRQELFDLLSEHPTAVVVVGLLTRIKKLIGMA